MEKIDVVDLEYKNCKIHAYKIEWKEINDKSKEIIKRKYICQLYRNDRWLNLGEMSDGSNFTAVSQSVNEAKWLVDYHLEMELDKKLLNLPNEIISRPRFLRSDLDKYNGLRITERLEIKEKLLKEVDWLISDVK